MIATIVGIAMMCFGVILQIRNSRVGRYRQALIRRIGQACDSDIKRGQHPSWRWKEFGTVSYDRMFWQFWKSVDSFYANDPAREIDQPAVDDARWVAIGSMIAQRHDTHAH